MFGVNYIDRNFGAKGYRSRIGSNMLSEFKVIRIRAEEVRIVNNPYT